MISKYKPTLLLQKMHVGVEHANQVIKSLGRHVSCYTTILECLGGIILTWNIALLQIHIIPFHDQCIYVVVQESHSKSWLLIVIYTNNNVSTRNTVWNALAYLDFSWCLIGDFNHSINKENKKDGSNFAISISVHVFLIHISFDWI